MSSKKGRRRKKPSLTHEIFNLLAYLSKRRKRQFGILLVLMIVSSLSEVISLGAILPFLIALNNSEQILLESKWQPFLETFSITSPIQLLTALAFVFITAVLISNGLRILTIRIQTNCAAQISSDLSCKLYGKILQQPYQFYLKHNSSDLINTVTQDTRQLTINILLPLMFFISNSFVVLALGFGLLLIEGRISVVMALALGGVYIGVFRLRQNLLQRNSQTLVASSQRQIKVVQEALGGIREVLIGKSQSYFQETYHEADLRYRQAVATNMIVTITPRYMIEAMAMVFIGLLALVMGRSGNFNEVVPILGSLALGANRLLPALQQTFTSLAKMQGTRVSLQRILTGLQRPIDPIASESIHAKLEIQSALRISNVWLKYNEDADWVLKDVNFDIKPRTTVGICGEYREWEKYVGGCDIRAFEAPERSYVC